MILADGNFPVHPVPLGYLRNAERIICCDGSTASLLETGLAPDAIVGDIDSLDAGLAIRFSDRIFKDNNQETNDLTKAVEWCSRSGFNDIVVLGATGKREDHTIGNISLLAEYSKKLSIRMITDNGVFMAFHENCTIASAPGQQVSVFSIDPHTPITSSGLLYPLNERCLNNWWEATLNEATGDEFTLSFTGGPVIVFLKFMEEQIG